MLKDIVFGPFGCALSYDKSFLTISSVLVLDKINGIQLILFIPMKTSFPKIKY